MPTDFNKAADNNIAISQPIQPPPVDQNISQGESMPPAKEKPLTLRELLTMGLAQPDIDRVNLICDKLRSGDFLINFMFDPNTLLDLNINRHISASLRILSTSEREEYEAYLYGKDPLGLYADKDAAEIADIKKTESMSDSQARELFLRSFPKDIAQARYSRVALSASLVKLQGKSLGKTVKERFEEIGKLPIYLTQQITGYLGLIERAVKIELSDDGTIKN